MVGEIREETAQIAIQSALTGHLVSQSPHANNVINIMGKFLNMGVEPYNLRVVAQLVLAQRLVAVLCSRRPGALPPDRRRADGMGICTDSIHQWLFTADVGCDTCKMHAVLSRSTYRRSRARYVGHHSRNDHRTSIPAPSAKACDSCTIRGRARRMSTLHEINGVTFVEEIGKL